MAVDWFFLTPRLPRLSVSLMTPPSGADVPLTQLFYDFFLLTVAECLLVELLKIDLIGTILLLDPATLALLLMIYY